MRTRSSLLSAGVLALAVTATLLAGCDGARQSVAEAIRPASAAEVAGTLREQIAKGDFSRASADGAAWLANQADPSGVVAWETAKASAQAGKADAAIRFAGMAVQGGAVDTVRLMTEPMLEPVRLDARLVALAAGGGPAPDGRAGSLAPAVTPALAPAPSNAAAASIGADGIKASAGDVSVQLPD
ncbi:hypothetical protein AB2N08_16215 [Massilia aurea]|uniref:hypothetical protein n=1 Tax=Massilia aurea TaxID=373040 RepID=UPI003462B1F9